MAHSFLLESAVWSLNGHWLQSEQTPTPVQGKIAIAWKPQNWFKIVTEIRSSDETDLVISCQFRGNLNYEEKYYTYVSQHSLLGNIEGEGRLGLQSIVQYSWSIGSNTQKRGFDTFYCLDKNTYHFTSTILDKHNLENTIEATLKREP